MDKTIPAVRGECRADELKPGVRVADGFLPLRRSAEVLFAYPYTLHGKARVLVVYLYDGDGQPAPDDFLAESLIPLGVANPTRMCEWTTPGQGPEVACRVFPFCDCPGPDES